MKTLEYLNEPVIQASESSKNDYTKYGQIGIEPGEMLYSDYLIGQSHNGVSGIHEIDSGVPGPTLVVSAHMHGGESPGSQTLCKLEELGIGNHLSRGKLMFILGNIDGFRKYMYSDGDHKLGRAIDHNMNRIGDIDILMRESGSEVTRLLDLYEAAFSRLNTGDMHIDLHSTGAPSNPFAVISQASADIVDILNISEVYTGIIDHQVGKPAINLSEQHGAQVVGIELCQHTSADGYKYGVDNVLRACLHLNLLTIDQINRMKTDTDIEFPMTELPKEEHSISGSHVITGSGFRFAIPDVRNLTSIKSGTLIGHDGDTPILAPSDGNIVLPNTRAAIQGAEAFFFEASHTY